MSKITCGKNCSRYAAFKNARFRKNVFVLAAGIILFTAGLLTGKYAVLSVILFSLSWFVTGYEVLLHAVSNIAKGRIFDENFLMAIATIGAFATGQYPEAAAVMLFYKIGTILESQAVDRSRKSIANLIELRPEKANIKTESGIIEVKPETIQAGDMLLVKPGERVPVDGIVVEGESVVDTSSLTGESLPKSVGAGDRLLGGYINKTGLLTIQAVSTLKQSAASRVLELVEEAVSRKSSAESFISRFSAYYTPAVTAAALLTAVLPPIITGSMDFGSWIYRAMIFLVISCPCALVVSIPLTFFAGIGKASSRGILVKGSNYLEALNNVDTIVFDKTGTLTEGIFEVSGYSPSGCIKEELLEFAAYAEANSTHPIAQSISRAYGKEINRSLIESCEEFAGRGVKANIGGHVIIAGNGDFARSCGIMPDTDENASGDTDVYIAVDNEYKGRISVSDTLKKDAVDTIKKLRDKKIRRIAMLTGDSRRPAEAIAEKLNLDEVHYNLLPHNKVELFEKIKSNSKGATIFAGDGINDAPVLAVADIGVSMGGIGSDAAIEASDIVLMTDEPGKLAEAIDIAAMTRRIALQNIVFAITVKVLVLLLGAAGAATMWEAVIADVGVTLLTVMNSMRIRYTSIPFSKKL